MMASVAGPVVSPRPAAISAMDTITVCQYGSLTGMLAATRKPAPIAARPAATTSLVPKRRISIIATGENPAVTNANGSVAIRRRAGRNRGRSGSTG
jgi:hypothetical protein